MVLDLPDWKRSVHQNMFEFRFKPDPTIYRIIDSQYLPYELFEQVIDPRLSQKERDDASLILFLGFVEDMDKATNKLARKQPRFILDMIVKGWLKLEDKEDSEEPSLLGKS